MKQLPDYTFQEDIFVGKTSNQYLLFDGFSESLLALSCQKWETLFMASAPYRSLGLDLTF